VLEEFKRAFQRPNNSHIQLIIVNVVVYLILVVMYVFSNLTGFSEYFDIVLAQLEIPASFISFLSKPWTIITYAFVHDYTGIFHILFNMLVFYWFGKLFIEYLGSDKLVAVYVLGALAGGISYLLVYNTIAVPSDDMVMVGASAAVYAVLVATATLLPDYTFFLLFFGPVRIKYIALIYIVISFIGLVGSNAGGNVAHLGGVIMGYVYTKQLQVGVNWGGWITITLEWFKGLFQPRSKVKVTYRSNESKSTSTKKAARPKNSTTQDEIDAILDKISDRGYDSLTKEEKEKLFNASKK